MTPGTDFPASHNTRCLFLFVCVFLYQPKWGFQTENESNYRKMKTMTLSTPATRPETRRSACTSSSAPSPSRPAPHPTRFSSLSSSQENWGPCKETRNL